VVHTGTVTSIADEVEYQNGKSEPHRTEPDVGGSPSHERVKSKATAETPAELVPLHLVDVDRPHVVGARPGAGVELEVPLARYASGVGVEAAGHEARARRRNRSSEKPYVASL
jgi:hypothetical protein